MSACTGCCRTSRAGRSRPRASPPCVNAWAPGRPCEGCGGGACRRAARAARAARLPLLRPRRSGGPGRRVRPADAASCARSRPPIPTLDHARFPDAARLGHPEQRLRRGRAPRADALARQRLHRGGPDAPSTGASMSAWGSSGELEYVAEPKLDGLAVTVIYRDGQLSAGRHARRRRDRRGRDRQRAHHPRGAATAARHGAGAAGGARRGVHAARRLRAHERAGAGTRREGVRQSAQRGRRQPAAAGSAHHGGAAADGVLLRAGRARGGAAAGRSAGAAAAGCGRSGCRCHRKCARCKASAAAWSTTATSARGAARCRTRSMAWSTSSSAAPTRSAWATCRARRAGRSRTSFPPTRHSRR